MALISCRQCHARVSSQTKKCPQCGEQLVETRRVRKSRRKPLPLILIVLIALMIGVSLGLVVVYQSSNHDPEMQHFSRWDGSHIKLVEYVKYRMHDPDSFEHAKTEAKSVGDRHRVMMTYRGNNGFGAKMRHAIVAECNKETGEVIEILGED